MPSFRVCLAYIAVATLAFTPVALSTVTDAAGTLLERADSFSKNILVDRALTAPNLYKRETAQDAAARIRLAKKRAARKIKRDAVDIQRRGTKTFTGGITSAFATYLDTKCSRSKQCQNAKEKANLPTNGAAVCNLESRHCVIDCQQGYLVQNDGSCFKGETTCPSLKNGIYTLDSGVCKPQCNSHLGYTLSGSSTSSYKCTNTVIDKNNCGSLGHKCPGSYNGVGSRQCVSGVCGLRCPTGRFQYPGTGGGHYCA